MRIHTSIVTEQDWKWQVTDFISSFDHDLSGDNGDECTSELALSNGFQSDIEYFIALASSQPTFKMKLTEVMERVNRTYYSYSSHGYKIELLPNETDYLITFAYQN